MTKIRAVWAALRPVGHWNGIPGSLLLILGSLAVHVLLMGFSLSGETRPPELIRQTLTLEIAELEAERPVAVPPAPAAPLEEAPPLPDEPELRVPDSDVALPMLPDAPDAPALPDLPEWPELPDLPPPPLPPDPQTPPPPARQSQGNTGGLNLPIARDHVIKPRYPEAARRDRREGRVLLRIAVRASGRVGDVSVVRSSGHEDLDRAAIEALRRSRFHPATRNGEAVEGALEQEVVFELEGK